MSQPNDADGKLISLEEIVERHFPPEEWFHYTTIGGLRGILDTSALWGTHIAFLNDSQELEYGVEALARLVRIRAEQMPEFTENEDGTNSFHPIASLWQGTDQSMLDRKEELKQEYGPFVSCLSRSRDQLSQWRGYGRGGGYAVRFDPSVLKESIRQVDLEGKPVPDAPIPEIEWVAYVWHNFREQIEWSVQKYIDDSIALVAEPGMSEAEIEAMVEGPRNDFYERVVYLASRMKDLSFREEDETRILSQCDETFYTESPSLGLIPRTSFGFDKEAVKEIIVGPGDYAEARAVSIERFLRRHPRGYKHVEVTQSKVPYRDI